MKSRKMTDASTRLDVDFTKCAHESLKYASQLEGFLVIFAVIVIDLYLTRLVSTAYKKLEKYDLEKERESVQLRQEEIRLLLDTLRKFEK